VTSNKKGRKERGGIGGQKIGDWVSLIAFSCRKKEKDQAGRTQRGEKLRRRGGEGVKSNRRTNRERTALNREKSERAASLSCYEKRGYHRAKQVVELKINSKNRS